MTRASVEDLVPLNPDVFAILLALLDADGHGYELMKRTEGRRGRRGQLQPGALYRLLRNMLERGLIAELERREVPEHTDERRRYYRITPFGRTVAAAEARRMADLVALSTAHRLLET